MARRYLVSKGTVRSFVPWQDPAPPNTRVLEEHELEAFFGGPVRDTHLKRFAAPDEPPKKRTRRRKDSEGDDPFSDST